MRRLFHRKYIPLTLIGLVVVVAVLVRLIPPETNLGSTIRIVLLHGALARVGLIAFAAAGVLGAVLLVVGDDRLASWTLATQKTAFIVWVAGALASAVATYLSWGVVIAWGEPRTQGTLKILALGLVLLALVLWIRQHRFTGLANLVLGAFSWWTVTGAASVQHPENPVGNSPSDWYRTVFLLIVVFLIVTAAQLTRWMCTPSPADS